MHKIRNKYFLAGTSIVVMLIGLFVLTPIFFVSGAQSTGGNTLIGNPPLGNGMTSFEDKDSGDVYNFRLIASEDDGKVTMFLEGPSLTLCTARGSAASITFPEGPIGDPYGSEYSGNYPLNDIQCGTAYAMAVFNDGCQADIEFHGYVHSDYPWVTYMGMMTTDVKIKTGTDPEDNEIEIKIYTPKEEIELEGTFLEYIEMDTCP